MWFKNIVTAYQVQKWSLDSECFVVGAEDDYGVSDDTG
jgi:hypothetical protein